MRIEDIWFSSGVIAKIARLALSPFSAVFGVITSIRNHAYSHDIFKVHPSSVYTISVGNLTVGGTGKTPITSFLVSQLKGKGLNPAVVMRGYGDDEPLVHRELNPSVNVVVNSDRVAGIAEAANNGANVVVLDDAFQHRRAQRHFDIVLVSVEQWMAVNGAHNLLPAGPYREKRTSLERSSAVVLTQKTASDTDVGRVKSEVAAMAGAECVIYVASLQADRLKAVAVNEVNAVNVLNEDRAFVDNLDLPLSDLRGKSVLAFSGIGDPHSFFGQLRTLGARVSERTFPDHHKYTLEDVSHILATDKTLGNGSGADFIVTTLKDAVKLRGVWAANNPRLWYVSQAVQLTPKSGLIETVTSNIFTLGRP